MTYETIARIAQQGGLIYFAAIFFAGCVYALLPRHRDTFKAAARLPLEDHETPHDPA